MVRVARPPRPLKIDQPPDPGAYRYVLRRYDWHPNSPRRFEMFDLESHQSQRIPLNGIVAHTLFIRTEPARLRLIKLGWSDDTERWQRALECPELEAAFELRAATVPVKKKESTRIEIVKPDRRPSRRRRKEATT